MMKPRKVPTRTCTGCGAASTKRELVRFVRTPEGHVELDASGKADGRGAYLCVDPDCFELARRRRKLDSALRVRMQDDDYLRLRRDFDGLLASRDPKQGE